MEIYKTRAEEIKNETRKGANTAVRIGGFLRDLLDRLTELFAAMNTAIQGKVDKETGKGLSSNDFSNEYKSQLDNLEHKGYAQTMYVEGILDSTVSVNLDFNSISGQPLLTRGREFTVKMPSGLTSTSGLLLRVKAGGNTIYQQGVAYRNGAAVPANEFIAGGTYRFVSTGDKDTFNRPIFSLTSDAVKDANDQVEQAATTNSTWRNVLLSLPSGNADDSLSDRTGKAYMSDDVKVNPGRHILKATLIQQGSHQVLDKGMVDAELSDTSENPVQNKVIEAAIGNIKTLPLTESENNSYTIGRNNTYSVIKYIGTSNVYTISGFYSGPVGKLSYILLINDTENDVTIMFDRTSTIKICQVDDILLPAGKAIEISACFANFASVATNTLSRSAIITCSDILTVNF